MPCIHLYEKIIEKDGSRVINYDRSIGNISCDGNGMPGNFEFYDTCNEIWTVKDPSHPCYEKKRVIFTDMDKRRLRRLFNQPIDVITDGGWDNGRHYIEGKKLEPWLLETIDYITDYTLASSLCGTTIAAETTLAIFPEDVYPSRQYFDYIHVHFFERIIESDGASLPGRYIGALEFKGDGSSGKLFMFDNRYEVREIYDVNSPFYGKGEVILSNEQLNHLDELLSNPLHTGGDEEGTEEKILKPWYRETVEYIVRYLLPCSIMGIFFKPELMLTMKRLKEIYGEDYFDTFE